MTDPDVGRQPSPMDRVQAKLEEQHAAMEDDKQVAGLMDKQASRLTVPMDASAMRAMAMPLITEAEAVCPVEAVGDQLIITRQEAVNKVTALIQVSDKAAQKSRPYSGEIVSLGPDSQNLGLFPGDRIIYHEYAQVTIRPEGIEYTAIKYRDVICKYKARGQSAYPQASGTGPSPSADG